MSDCSDTAERWIPVVGWEEYYDVSDLGRIRNRNRMVRCANGRTWRQQSRIMRLRRRKDGHLELRLSGDCRHATVFVHTLVLTAFVGPPPPRMECCHGPGGPADNRLTNLRWDTKSANKLDRQRDGTDHKRNRTHCPREHRLVMPNLIASHARKGFRNCLACHRAAGNAQHARLYGHQFDFRATANRHYAKIMEGSS